jgi:hypothetical protein
VDNFGVLAYPVDNSIVIHFLSTGLYTGCPQLIHRLFTSFPQTYPQSGKNSVQKKDP